MERERGAGTRRGRVTYLRLMPRIGTARVLARAFHGPSPRHRATRPCAIVRRPAPRGARATPRSSCAARPCCGGGAPSPAVGEGRCSLLWRRGATALLGGGRESGGRD